MFRRWLLPRAPNHLLALAAAFLLVFLLHPPQTRQDGLRLAFSLPLLFVPRFSVAAFLSVSLPLALLSLTDCLKGFGVLKGSGYDPPMNTVVTASGVVSMLAGPGLTHAISFAGAGTAIVAGDNAGPLPYRYAASVLKNIAVVLIAPALGFLLPLLNILPEHISNLMAGLAMLSLFTNSLCAAFGRGGFPAGAFAAMLVGLSGVSVGMIGTPILALMSGILVSYCMEQKDFRRNSVP